MQKLPSMRLGNIKHTTNTVAHVATRGTIRRQHDVENRQAEDHDVVATAGTRTTNTVQCISQAGVQFWI